MQTFLPYASFTESARVLDNRRLGKQRVECDQILRALSNESYGWQNHPAVRMWRGYSQALQQYMDAILHEWVTVRGFKNSYSMHGASAFEPPPWIGDESFHAAHRSNLLRKNPEWYGRFGWTESPDLPYVWPKVPPCV